MTKIKKTTSAIITVEIDGVTYSVVIDTQKNKIGLRYTTKKRKYTSYSSMTSHAEAIQNVVEKYKAIEAKIRSNMI